MHGRRVALIAAAVVALTAREAAGDIYHLKTPSTVETDGGSKLRLPPGYFLDEKAWQDRDLELRELQERDVRLRAENESLRKSASEPPWLAIGVAGAVGIALGVFLVVRLK